MNETIPVEMGRILILDDELANATTLQMLLEDAGFLDVIATTSHVEALEICDSQDIDLFILDLNMPVMDGFEVMARLFATEKELKPLILMLTAQNSRDYRRRALASGARDYVTKPFDSAELFARVRNLLEMKLLQNRMRSQKFVLEEVVRKRTSELLESQERLMKSRLAVVQRLSRAAEYRDNETGNHILRMSRISAVLAKGCGFDQYDCNLVLHASPMHDIGKIGVPDSILLKPGKLDPHEWEIMKTHTQKGADILADSESDLLSMASVIAITHHERWDGTGYPAGLRGLEIPTMGRICAVADVFDALTSERPYKKAWSVDQALEHLKKESGSHFEPALVSLFMDNLDQILEIKNTYKEPDEQQ